MDLCDEIYEMSILQIQLLLMKNRMRLDGAKTDDMKDLCMMIDAISDRLMQHQKKYQDNIEGLLTKARIMLDRHKEVVN